MDNVKKWRAADHVVSQIGVTLVTIHTALRIRLLPAIHTALHYRQPHSIAFGGVFPHYKGDSNTTKLTIKRQFFAQNDQFTDKTPP